MERCGRANTLVDMNSVSIGVPAYDSTLLSAMSQRVLIGDGAMGTMLQAADLTLDDFLGLEGCNEILNVTRPDIVRAVHRAYLEVGVDAIETNTFGSFSIPLAEYGIAAEASPKRESSPFGPPRPMAVALGCEDTPSSL